MHTLLAPGDHVVCTFPGYQSLYAVAASMGCEVSRWQPVEDQGWRFDLTQLDGLLRANTRLVVVNFPHNPTGSLPSAEEFAAMVETLTARGIYLLADEMYRFLELDRQAPLPAGCELYERGVSLGGLSKSFGLPGLRMGWIATRDREVLAGMAQLKDYTTICSSAPSEILALIALGARRQIVGDQKARLQRNLRALQELLESPGGRHWRVNLPAGGSLCFARLPGLEDTASFCQEVIRETGILLVPGELFEYGHQYIRIGFGREDFPAVLGRFTEFLGRRME
jgi:aspartate/methionine/tyrosine aminotransferase